MRAWWAFRLGAALIAAAYAADQVVGQALKESLATFSSTWVMTLDVMARVAVVALGLALARLVFRGPRSRPAGLAMAILGFYFGLLPELSLPLTETTGTQIQTTVHVRDADPLGRLRDVGRDRGDGAWHHGAHPTDDR